MRRITILFDGNDNSAEEIHHMLTAAKAEVVGSEAEYSAKNPMNRDSLELLGALESQPYGWACGVRTPKDDHSLNTLTVVVRVPDEEAWSLLEAVAGLGEVTAYIMQNIEDTPDAPLLIRTLTDEFEQRVSDVLRFAGKLTPEQRRLNPGLTQELAGVVTPPLLGPALTMEAIIAYMRSRGYIVEPNDIYAGGHHAYKLVEQDGEMRHSGCSLESEFVAQIAADARSALREARTAQVRAEFE